MAYAPEDDSGMTAAGMVLWILVLIIVAGTICLFCFLFVLFRPV